jgi:hypothetical protein
MCTELEYIVYTRQVVCTLGIFNMRQNIILARNGNYNNTLGFKLQDFKFRIEGLDL